MIEILKYTIPALLVLITAYVLLDIMFKNEEKRRAFEIHKKNSSIVTPIRLRAYERLILVLERTTPNIMVVTNIKPGMTCLELQSNLINYIRQEFGHNAAQQIYVSDELWTSFRSTQESLIHLINNCASKFQAESEATKLAELIINVFASSDQTPTEISINLLKKETRILM
jgi:hypothetical protein